MEKYPKCYKATFENKKENTKPSASNQRSISDKVKIRNHRQPLYSKRPHNLPVKEKRQENICSIRNTNSTKQTKGKNKGVSDIITNKG